MAHKEVDQNEFDERQLAAREKIAGQMYTLLFALLIAALVIYQWAQYVEPRPWLVESMGLARVIGVILLFVWGVGQVLLIQAGAFVPFRKSALKGVVTIVMFMAVVFVPQFPFRFPILLGVTTILWLGVHFFEKKRNLSPVREETGE